jgi:hypothetical protein
LAAMEGPRWPNVGGRAWFDDADRFGRRLAVHARPERGWITLSVWEGNECRATFHVHPRDIPRLVYELAEGLAGRLAAGPPQPGRWPAPTFRGSLGPIWERAAARAGRLAGWLGRRRRPGATNPRLRVVEAPGPNEERSSG